MHASARAQITSHYLSPEVTGGTLKKNSENILDPTSCNCDFRTLHCCFKRVVLQLYIVQLSPCFYLCTARIW